MQLRKDLRVVELPINHYQLLRSERTIGIIRDAKGGAKAGFYKKTFRLFIASQVRLGAD
jgi:hypothetical protein